MNGAYLGFEAEVLCNVDEGSNVSCGSKKMLQFDRYAATVLVTIIANSGITVRNLVGGF